MLLSALYLSEVLLAVLIPRPLLWCCHIVPPYQCGSNYYNKARGHFWTTVSLIVNQWTMSSHLAPGPGSWVWVPPWVIVIFLHLSFLMLQTRSRFRACLNNWASTSRSVVSPPRSFSPPGPFHPQVLFTPRSFSPLASLKVLTNWNMIHLPWATKIYGE